MGTGCLKVLESVEAKVDRIDPRDQKLESQPMVAVKS